MPLSADKILLYGATGFTGKLTVKVISQQNDAFFKSRIILAGRSLSKLTELGKESGFPIRCFDLHDTMNLNEALKDVCVALHMAGPFIHTALPMLMGCIRNQCHYLDITGEQEVMKLIHEVHAESIRKAGILAICGVGFDIVPTDCLAASLAQALPSATHLELAFSSNSMTPSAGTTLTSVEAICQGTKLCTRQKGEMVPVRLGYKTKTVSFPTVGERFVSFIPWGDCYSAYFTTRIPNVDVFISSNRYAAPISYYMVPLLAWLIQTLPFLGRLIKFLIPFVIHGPSETVQKTGTVDVWGQVRNARTGECVTGTLVVPEGYVFTARAALASAKRVVNNQVSVRSGPGTPGSVFGADFVQSIEGVVSQGIKRTP